MSATSMTDPDTQAIRDDLAFLRGLVQREDGLLRGFGRGYFAGGACYGVQTLLGLAAAVGWLPTASGLLGLLVGFGPTVVFVVALVVIIRLDSSRMAPTQVAKGMGAVFGAVGLANLALICVIGSVAAHEKSFTIWLIYPCVVFILQGAAWLTTYALRRRAWIMALAMFWFACAIVMGLTITQLPLYLAVASLGLLLGMAAPGAWLMTRKGA